VALGREPPCRSPDRELCELTDVLHGRYGASVLAEPGGAVEELDLHDAAPSESAPSRVMLMFACHAKVAPIAGDVILAVGGCWTT
jgi:hypothetical protein